MKTLPVLDRPVRPGGSYRWKPGVQTEPTSTQKQNLSVNKPDSPSGCELRGTNPVWQNHRHVLSYRLKHSRAGRKGSGPVVRSRVSPRRLAGYQASFSPKWSIWREVLQSRFSCTNMLSEKLLQQNREVEKFHR